MKADRLKNAKDEAITVLTQLHGSHVFKDIESAKLELEALEKRYDFDLPRIYNDYIEAVESFRNDDLEAALSQFEACIEIIDEPSLEVLEAYCCVYLGTIHAATQDFHHSLHYFSLAEVKRREHDHKLALFLNVNLSAIYFGLGNYEKAKICSESAINHGNKLESPPTYGIALCNLALAQVNLNDVSAAAVTIEQAIAYSRKHGFERALAYALFYHAHISSLGGDIKEAFVLYKSAFEAVKKHDDSYLRGEFYEYYSAFLLSVGHYEFAIKFCKSALNSGLLERNSKVKTKIYQVIADSYHQLGQVKEEAIFLRKVSELYQASLAQCEQKEAYYIESVLDLTRVGNQANSSKIFTDSLQQLNAIGQHLMGFDGNTSTVLETYHLISDLISCSAMSLAFYHQDTNSLEYRYLIEEGNLVEGFEISCDGISRIGVYCAVNQETVLLDTSTQNEIDSYLDPKYKSSNSYWVNSEAGIQGTSVISTPVMFGGKLLAILSVQKNQSHVYQDFHVQVVQQIANYFSLSFTNYQNVQSLESNRLYMEQIFKTDHLTDLKNGFAIPSYLESLKREATEPCKVSSVLLDIDYLKNFNNAYGMAAGDNLLVTVATILKHVSQGVGEVFRLGGDEFAVVLVSEDPQLPVMLAKKVKAYLSRSQIVNVGSELDRFVTCSIGIIEPAILDDVSYFEQQLLSGERALIKAKKQQRNCLLRYSLPESM